MYTCQNTTLLDIMCNVSALLSSEMHYLSIGKGLTLSPMENYQVFL